MLGQFDDVRFLASKRVSGDFWTHPRRSLSSLPFSSTFSLGTLGNSIFGMGLTEACLVIVFFNLLCTIPVALFSTWGAQTGLRQMVIGRYSFGIIGIYFPVLLNCIVSLVIRPRAERTSAMA